MVAKVLKVEFFFINLSLWVLKFIIMALKCSVKNFLSYIESGMEDNSFFIALFRLVQ
uniref:Uncharacterized protein n=1 Tax=Rhizophora mucronata TaxID=61149 RepID=A0A2P2R165_RHIMU